ncbi:hypothetical protein DPV78_003478 [Talaromyces pinophilus]|nr:hypothetical protein DPV78_003478 [Talaromyces pinophilus]
MKIKKSHYCKNRLIISSIEHNNAQACIQELIHEGSSLVPPLIDIKNKLELNTNYYPTPLAYIQYVKSMCKGEAVDHLYQNIDDIIKHLKIIYHNVNKPKNRDSPYLYGRIIIAKNKKHTLKNYSNKGGGCDSARKDSRKDKNSIKADKLKDSREEVAYSGDDKIEVKWDVLITYKLLAFSKKAKLMPLKIKQVYFQERYLDVDIANVKDKKTKTFLTSISKIKKAIKDKLNLAKIEEEEEIKQYLLK